MKYLQGLKNYFYCEEKRHSASQLMEDFGGFPPVPLNCKSLGLEFRIVKTRGIGGLYASLSIFNRLLKVKESNEIHESIHGPWKEILAVRSNLKIQLKTLSNITKTKVDKIVFALVLMPLVCLIAPILVPVFALKITSLLMAIYRRIPKGLGYFIPLFVDENRIVIRVGAIQNKNDTMSIISHEHLHFLQHKNGEFDNKNSRCNDLLLSDKWKDDRFLLYLLERNEVEARLHEIVISYHRIKNTLPSTMEGFVEILVGSNKFGSLVVKAMGLDGVALEQVVTKYHERNTMVAEDVQLILLAIRDINLRRRFITEVLAVMYGNLINYYGDKEASLSFLKKIERPNLYDMLYA